MNHILSILLVAFCLAVAGCDSANVNPDNANQTTGTSPSKQAAEQSMAAPADLFPPLSDTNDVKLNGWKIHYPKSLKQMKMGMNDNVLTITFEEFSLEVRDNRIFVDGKDYGAASKGDDVLIGLTGEIAVNGKIRTPQPAR